MKTKNIILWLLSIVITFLLIGFISNYIGWYGYKKWEHRVSSKSIDESKKRNVFVKDLNYKIDSTNLDNFNFAFFIEKGYKFGKHSSKETKVVKNSKYPYNFSFNHPDQSIGILIPKEVLSDFDSANLTRGYLKNPHLNDTIYLIIGGQDSKGKNIYGNIKVWD